MRIVFVDIDGVLAPYGLGVSQRAVCQDVVANGVVEFDAGCVAELNLICDTGQASIVLSSSWRYAIRDVVTCRSVFRDQGVSAPVIGLTPMFRDDLTDRGDEVMEFVRDYGDSLESFVILDDSKYSWPGCRDRWIPIRPYRGITRRDAKRAISLLQAESNTKGEEIESVRNPGSRE